MNCPFENTRDHLKFEKQKQDNKSTSCTCMLHIFKNTFFFKAFLTFKTLQSFKVNNLYSLCNVMFKICSPIDAFISCHSFIHLFRARCKETLWLCAGVLPGESISFDDMSVESASGVVKCTNVQFFYDLNL